MTPERWKEVETVLQGALDRPPLERASFLDTACAGDEELKLEATTLIAAYDEAGDFIEQPAIAHDAKVLLGNDLEGHIGREFGPYRIIERLGAGGMGEVYLAQDTRLNRLVALKLLPAYFASDDARLRHGRIDRKVIRAAKTLFLCSRRHEQDRSPRRRISSGSLRSRPGICPTGPGGAAGGPSCGPPCLRTDAPSTVS